MLKLLGPLLVGLAMSCSTASSAAVMLTNWSSTIASATLNGSAYGQLVGENVSFRLVYDTEKFVQHFSDTYPGPPTEQQDYMAFDRGGLHAATLTFQGVAYDLLSPTAFLQINNVTTAGSGSIRDEAFHTTTALGNFFIQAAFFVPEGQGTPVPLLHDAPFNSAVVAGGDAAVATTFGTLEVKFGGPGSLSISAVPEPGMWGMMIIGFGATGAMVRSRRRRVALADV